jgi:hypothetical protein
MTQINISEITNGFLVATPGAQNPLTGQVQEGKVTFFESIEAVKQALPQFFPADLG